MLVKLEQPSNCRDKGLNGAGIDLVRKVLHFPVLENGVEVFQRGVISHKSTDIHGFIYSAGAKALEILAYCHVELTKLIWLKKHLPF